MVMRFPTDPRLPGTGVVKDGVGATVAVVRGAASEGVEVLATDFVDDDAIVAAGVPGVGVERVGFPTRQLLARMSESRAAKMGKAVLLGAGRVRILVILRSHQRRGNGRGRPDPDPRK